MLKRAAAHLRRHFVAYLALFFAIAGTAAATLPLNQRFVKGHGKLSSRSFSSPETGFITNPPTLASIPGFGKVQFLACFNREIRVRLLSNDNASNFSFSGEVRAGGVPAGTGQDHTVDMDGGVLGHGGGTPLIARPTANGFTLGMTGKWDWRVWRGNGSHTKGAQVFVSGEDSDGDNTCRVSATTYLQK